MVIQLEQYRAQRQNTVHTSAAYLVAAAGGVPTPLPTHVRRIATRPEHLAPAADAALADFGLLYAEASLI